MIKLSQAVIVEGKYDKIKLSSLLDAVIITTDGFGIYKDKEKTELIRTLADTCGIIILTDSDSAGLRIRNHIKGCCKNGNIINVFVPQIKGKEKRKIAPSAEGYLGVEGLDSEILKSALSKAGITAENDSTAQTHDFLTKSDMMDDGMIGAPGSSVLRRNILLALGLPPILSANTMLEVINRLYTKEEYENAVIAAKNTEN
ncbi:MAG: toprim domain-containing protein [Ruminiclostridium sp.]